MHPVLRPFINLCLGVGGQVIVQLEVSSAFLAVPTEKNEESHCVYLTVQPAPSSEDLSVASRIVKWITKQQNPQGGFSSTQVCGDTLF